MYNLYKFKLNDLPLNYVLLNIEKLHPPSLIEQQHVMDAYFSFAIICTTTSQAFL